MNNFKKFTCIVYNEDDSVENQIYKDKEIEVIYVGIKIDVSQIEAYQEVINDADGNENCTMLHMKSGNLFYVNLPEKEFEKQAWSMI